LESHSEKILHFRVESVLPVFIRKRIEHRPNLLKILENIGWLFFDKILRMGVGLVVGIWVARYLGPEQFGVLSFSQAFVGLFAAIATMGVRDIVVRDIVRGPEHERLILGTAALIQIIGGLIAYLLACVFIVYLRPDDPIVQGVVAILGSLMLYKASDIAVYWFEAKVLSKYTVWVQNGTFLVFSAIKVILILYQFPLISFAWAMLAESVVVALILLVVLGKRGPSIFCLRFSAARAKGLLSDSWPLVVSALAVSIYFKVDQVMIGQMLGNEAVGVYSAAVRISELWYFIPVVVVGSVFPSIIEAKKRSDALYYARLQSLFDVMSLMSVPIAIIMTIVAPFVIDVLYGSAYEKSDSVLIIHIWISIFVFLGVANSKWFLVEDLQRLMFVRAVLSAVINILLNYILIPKYGVEGAAVASLIGYFIGTFCYDLFRSDTRKLLYMKLSSINIVRSICKRTWRSV